MYAQIQIRKSCPNLAFDRLGPHKESSEKPPSLEKGTKGLVDRLSIDKGVSISLRVLVLVQPGYVDKAPYNHKHIYTYTYMFTYTHIYMYIHILT